MPCTVQCANTKPTPPRRTGVDTWAQPDAVGARHCGARLAGRFKRPEPERRLWHPARRPRIESPGHWVKVGAGTRAQTRSQGGWVTTPVSGPPPPRGPLRPGRGLKVSFPFRAGSHRGGGGSHPLEVTPPPPHPRDRAERRKPTTSERRAALPRSPPPGGWSPLPGYPSLATPRLASTHPAVTGDSERARPQQLLDQCVGACGGRGVRGRGAGVRLQREAGREGGNHPCGRPEAPSPTWPRPEVCWKAGLPPSCDAGPRPTRLQPLPVSVPSSRGPRDTVGPSHVRRGFWVGGGWRRVPEWQ